MVKAHEPLEEPEDALERQENQDEERAAANEERIRIVQKYQAVFNLDNGDVQDVIEDLCWFCRYDRDDLYTPGMESTEIGRNLGRRDVYLRIKKFLETALQ